MKVCSIHWKRLEQVTKNRGLWDLVNVRDQELVHHTRVVSQPTRLDQVEPLVLGMAYLRTAAIERFGARIIHNNGFNLCPVCEAEKAHQEAWIEMAVDTVAEQARVLGQSVRAG